MEVINQKHADFYITLRDDFPHQFQEIIDCSKPRTGSVSERGAVESWQPTTQSLELSTEARTLKHEAGQACLQMPRPATYRPTPLYESRANLHSSSRSTQQVGRHRDSEASLYRAPLAPLHKPF